jgi:hypothetical protein
MDTGTIARFRRLVIITRLHRRITTILRRHIITQRLTTEDTYRLLHTMEAHTEDTDVLHTLRAEDIEDKT